MRPLASGTISFGLVSIPVKLFSATESSAAISFNMLHAKCGGRVKQQYICPRDDNAVVPREEMVKGYEFAKDRYVTFTPEELKALEEKASQQIEIAEFVPSDKIDPVYFDKAYYLGPEKGADRAYRLLAEAMRRSGKTALARLRGNSLSSKGSSSVGFRPSEVAFSSRSTGIPGYPTTAFALGNR